MAVDQLKHIYAFLPVCLDETEQKLGRGLVFFGSLCVFTLVNRLLIGRVVTLALIQRIDSLANQFSYFVVFEGIVKGELREGKGVELIGD